MTTLLQRLSQVLGRPSPEPELSSREPRPMTGFFAGLTAEQKAKALAYRGLENHGSDELYLGSRRKAAS
jgi:hypothetical protein